MENSKIKIASVDSFANATIKGSKSHTAYVSWTDLTKEETAQSAALNKEYSEFYKKKDQAGMDKIDAAFDKLTEQKNKAHKYKQKLEPISGSLPTELLRVNLNPSPELP